MKSHYIIPIFVPHKGCPHDCVFCNQKHITGQVDKVDSAFVENEIDKYLTTINSKDSFVEVSFFGGSFTGLSIDEQTELLKPAKKALDDNKVDAIRLSTRPDYINEVILANLKNYGVSIIELGVQSMDEDVLRLSNRGHSIDVVYKASQLIKYNGFTLGLQMMVGLPGDDEAKDIKTVEEFIKIKPDMVRIYPALVIKDTLMERMYKSGTFAPYTLDNAIDICSRLYLKFEYAGIKVIRIGLQPTENIAFGKDLIAGPFHPSFREHVESKILNDMILVLKREYNLNEFTIGVNPRTISKLFADKKKYFNNAIKTIGNNKIKVIQNNNIPIDSIQVMDSNNCVTLSIIQYAKLIEKKNK
jgi:histone acetyltransferase (RNA polymerase elongator complex component)